MSAYRPGFTVCLLFQRGWSEVLIKYTGKYVKIYFTIKITFPFCYLNSLILRHPYFIFQIIENN